MREFVAIFMQRLLTGSSFCGRTDLAKLEEAVYILHRFQKKKTAKFTIDALVEMLSQVGKPVRLAIG